MNAFQYAVLRAEPSNVGADEEQNIAMHERGISMFFEFEIFAAVTKSLDPGAGEAGVFDSERAVDLGRKHEVNFTDAAANVTLWVGPFVIHQ